MADGVTERLIENASSVTYDALPDEARIVARHCLLDWLGCAIAGSREPLTEIFAKEVAQGDAGDSTLIGRHERTSLLTAALVNGAMSHALDFDDTHTLMSGHPSAPVIPAALALAERDDIDGKSFLAAIVSGIEIECRLGALMNPGHYALGFHATGTLGAFGAAAAASHLLGLERDQWRHAMGLAGTQASGLKSGFGTMAKPLHAGRAAENGLLAALLAGGGYTGNTSIIEVEQGFAATHGAPGFDASRLSSLEGRWLIRDTLFKYHASCYLTHAAIEAASLARTEHRLAADEIESVELLASTACIGVCDIAEPRTGLELKFSLLGTTAMALLGRDTSDPASFGDDDARDDDLIAMRRRVRFMPMNDRPGTRAGVIVHARGRTFEAGADTGRPAADLDAQWSKLSAKFLALATPVLGAPAASELHAAVTQIERTFPMREVLALTRPLVPA